VHSGSAKRMVHLVRPTSPKSPVASESAYGSLEGTDEDDGMQDDPKLNPIYMHSNGNTVSQSVMVKVWFSICIL
jgi:AMP deaminase